MTGNEQFWWNWGVQLGVAIGTFAAACVALFGQAIRSKMFPPQLSLRLVRPEGERTRVKITSPPSEGSKERWEDARYYHVRVLNGRRWSPANQTQMFLIRVEEPGPDGRMQLVWIGDLPVQWRNQEVFPLTRTIGPDADCDLCSVIKDKWLSLHPLLVPYNLDVQKRGACNLVLSLQARSTQANSAITRVQISWDGKWEDGDQEMQRHLVVKVSDEGTA